MIQPALMDEVARSIPVTDNVSHLLFPKLFARSRV